jgi:hypothetical protein
MPEGSLRASAAGTHGATRLVSGSVVFATSGTTVAVDTLAIGDVVIQVWCQVTTAFNAATTNVITLGDGTTADKYLAAADVTEGTPGVYPTGGKGPFAADTTGAAKVYALITNLPE